MRRNVIVSPRARNQTNCVHVTSLSPYTSHHTVKHLLYYDHPLPILQLLFFLRRVFSKYALMHSWTHCFVIHDKCVQKKKKKLIATNSYSSYWHQVL